MVHDHMHNPKSQVGTITVADTSVSQYWIVKGEGWPPKRMVQILVDSPESTTSHTAMPDDFGSFEVAGQAYVAGYYGVRVTEADSPWPMLTSCSFVVSV